jgi:hypothetical protein
MAYLLCSKALLSLVAMQYFAVDLDHPRMRPDFHTVSQASSASLPPALPSPLVSASAAPAVKVYSATYLRQASAGLQSCRSLA